MVLGNPHFPWYGGERFYQFQLTLPGKLDVQGASLYGVPVVNIGFNQHVAWSHTVSTAWRFTPFRLQLAPNDPTAYVVDGKTEKMTSTTVSVKSLEGGRLKTQKHTFWYSRYGQLVTVSQAGFGWDKQYAYALGDVNADNLRIADVWLALDKAKSVGDLVKAQSKYQGVPWVNTIAADDKGQALYQDNSVVPHVTDQQQKDCIPAGLPAIVHSAAGIITLDGSRSACAWGSDPDAVAKGIFGPKKLPVLKRRDYVQNSNDSYWMTNSKVPITGIPTIVGDTNVALGKAVQELRDRGLPLDATTRQVQFLERRGVKIPVRGCDTGCYADIDGSVDPAGDSKSSGIPIEYGQVLYGSSIVETIELTKKGPKGGTILTYSESENPDSKHSGDQTKLFSENGWVPVTFTEKQILGNKDLKTTKLSGR
jgi:acyl-homoserine-lactone acylase